MTSTNTTLNQAILKFSEAYIQDHMNKFGHLPTIEIDEQWSSPCEMGSHDEGHNYWQPISIDKTEVDDKSTDSLSFINIETALNLQLHSDIKAYFTTIFSSDIEAECEEGQLSLLFAWNKYDFERLQENIIGHILMKQKLKQTETVFFGVTDEEDMIISIDNSTGEVWVERVGCKPHKKLSDSLATFISQLKLVNSK